MSLNLRTTRGKQRDRATITAAAGGNHPAIAAPEQRCQAAPTGVRQRPTRAGLASTCCVMSEAAEGQQTALVRVGKAAR
jgi:hypothetical protein